MRNSKSSLSETEEEPFDAQRSRILDLEGSVPGIGVYDGLQTSKHPVASAQEDHA